LCSVASARAPRSMPTAKAGTPYTTACSPSRITLPLALAITSLNTLREGTQGPFQELASLGLDVSRFECRGGVSGELVDARLDDTPGPRAFEHFDGALELTRSRARVAVRCLQRAQARSFRPL